MKALEGQRRVNRVKNTFTVATLMKLNDRVVHGLKPYRHPFLTIKFSMQNPIRIKGQNWILISLPRMLEQLANLGHDIENICFAFYTSRDVAIQLADYFFVHKINQPA